MSRLIDADALMEIIRAHDYPLATLDNAIDDGIDNGMFTIGIQLAVDECPTIEPPQGEWITVSMYQHEFDADLEEKCSLCGRYVYRYDTQPQDNYCPNCGAKMKGGET